MAVSNFSVKALGWCIDTALGLPAQFPHLRRKLDPQTGAPRNSSRWPNPEGINIIFLSDNLEAAS
ncbi:MAG: hypothetical protein WA172_09995 [Terriglobales bacterium]